MNSYEESLSVLKELFSEDHQFTLATYGKSIPSIRYVDACYDEGVFYVVTRLSTKKVKDIAYNNSVTLNDGLFNFVGTAENIGHPLKSENAAVREILKQRFARWYDKHCDEADEDSCYLKITPLHGFFYHGGIGYDIDFANKKAKSFPFDFDTIVQSQMGSVY